MREPPHPKSPLYPGWIARQELAAYKKWCDIEYAPQREASARVSEFKSGLNLPPKIRIRCRDLVGKKPRNEFYGGFDPAVKYSSELMDRIMAARIDAEKIIVEAGGMIVDSRDDKIAAKNPEGDLFAVFIT